MVGRANSLAPNPLAAERGLDLAPLLAQAETPAVLLDAGCLSRRDADRFELTDSHPDAIALEATRNGTAEADLSLHVCNRDRAVGTFVSGAMARHALRTGHANPAPAVTLRLTGSAGQSLGAFGATGLTIYLTGDANDYVGKGLSGARIVVRPPEDSPFRAEEQVLIGNVALYGATSGELLVRGRAGERFAVRNSGAAAVVEGVGDHGCDPDDRFRARFAGTDADLDRLAPGAPLSEHLWRLVARHAAETGSALAKALLDDWASALSRFVLVLPAAYRAALARHEPPERVRTDDASFERPPVHPPSSHPAPSLRGRIA
jgi:glutamate synthase domain-containing protein 3